MGLPANIKLYITITILFTILAIAGILFSYLALANVYEGPANLIGEQGLIQLTALAFVCFIVSTVITFNMLLVHLTRKSSGLKDEIGSEEPDQ